MTRPTSPPDPSSTVTDDEAEEPKTGEMTPITTETTAAELLPVPATDATFVELAPTVENPLPPPPAPRKSRHNHPVLAPSDVSLPPLMDVTGATTETRRQPDPGTTLTTEDPDPLAYLRFWLVSPRFRTRRFFAGGTLAVLLVAFGMMLGRSGASPAADRPVRPAPRAEPAEPPKLAPAPEVPKALQAAAPMFVEVEVDAGEGTTRLQKVEAGMIKIASMPETEVILGGQRLGPTPVFVTGPVGRVELVLESRDAGIYKPVAVQLLPGRNPGRMWELARGWLEVVAPPGSQISVDGRAAGAAPIPQLELYEGFHRLEVVRPDKSRVTKSVEVVPHFTTTHEISNP